MQIYNKAGEHLVIMAVREALSQPFTATNWTDLRVGFFVSACQTADPAGDDVTTGIGEVIGTDPVLLASTDYYIAGIGYSGSPANFLGYSNQGTGPRTPTFGSSRLVTSDSGVGTTNTNYWRIINGVLPDETIQITEGTTIRAHGRGWVLHVAQDATGVAAGYATLLRLRYQRDNATSRAKIITMSAPVNVSDAIYTNDPSATAMQNDLESFPTSVVQCGPVQLANAPNKLVWYWPYHQSRLRVHSVGILKVA